MTAQDVHNRRRNIRERWLDLLDTWEVTLDRWKHAWHRTLRHVQAYFTRPK